jgi:hypothetical protein
VIDSGLELLLPLSHASGSTEVRPHEIGIEREQFFLKKKKKRREKRSGYEGERKKSEKQNLFNYSRTPPRNKKK